MDFQEWLEGCKESARYSDSHYWFKTVGGYVKFAINDVCYQDIVCVRLEKLVVFHPFDEQAKPYVNFLLNSKWVGHVFHTKDAEEGFENGFSINVDVPANVLRGAIIMLRSPFEVPCVAEMFNHIKSLGHTDEEAFYFGTVLRYSNDIEGVRCGVTGHGIQVSPKTRLKDIIEGKLHQTSQNTARENASPGLVMTAFESGDRRDSIKPIIAKHPNVEKKRVVFEEVDHVPFTDANLSTLITLYKKEYDIG